MAHATGEQGPGGGVMLTCGRAEKDRWDRRRVVACIESKPVARDVQTCIVWWQDEVFVNATSW